jgi:hypothetical protein
MWGNSTQSEAGVPSIGPSRAVEPVASKPSIVRTPQSTASDTGSGSDKPAASQAALGHPAVAPPSLDDTITQVPKEDVGAYRFLISLGAKRGVALPNNPMLSRREWKEFHAVFMEYRKNYLKIDRERQPVVDTVIDRKKRYGQMENYPSPKPTDDDETKKQLEAQWHQASETTSDDQVVIVGVQKDKRYVIRVDSTDSPELTKYWQLIHNEWDRFFIRAYPLFSQSNK